MVNFGEMRNLQGTKNARKNKLIFAKIHNLANSVPCNIHFLISWIIPFVINSHGCELWVLSSNFPFLIISTFFCANSFFGKFSVSEYERSNRKVLRRAAWKFQTVVRCVHAMLFAYLVAYFLAETVTGSNTNRLSCSKRPRLAFPRSQSVLPWRPAASGR